MLINESVFRKYAENSCSQVWYVRAVLHRFVLFEVSTVKYSNLLTVEKNNG